MFENPVYIPPHAVEQFRGRVSNALSATTIRKLIQYFIATTEPIKYNKFNHEPQPIYKGEFAGKEFIIPVIKDKKKKKGQVWNVVPTILLPGMALNYRKDEQQVKKDKQIYLTAEELAREVGIDRNTIITRIKSGQIKALHHKFGEKYRIPLKEAEKFKSNFVRPYKRWYGRWTETEIYIIRNNKDKSNEYIANLLGRSKNAVSIIRCRLRKEGYDV